MEVLTSTRESEEVEVQSYLMIELNKLQKINTLGKGSYARDVWKENDDSGWLNWKPCWLDR